MTQAEAQSEDNGLAQAHRERNFDRVGQLPVLSLSTALIATIERGPSVLTIRLGGLSRAVQKIVVMLIIEHVKEICRRQTESYLRRDIMVPIYPSIYFEEAHMYMEDDDIDNLIPVIRHIGPNLFFITNTPGALPDSVIRLVDNLVLTRLINHKDVARVQDCGLADNDTISGFARDLPPRKALLLSGLSGCTQGFPLVFDVRDFGLPVSGITRSMWKALEEQRGSDGRSASAE
jgi:hypothetical protein